ncbi:MAG TPA: ABC transporter substrate-binding protein [Casimicrobiaceae bacterium]|nr:ABC transporter substrate-binding protein [Casimicrobiaceae bacterium]
MRWTFFGSPVSIAMSALLALALGCAPASAADMRKVLRIASNDISSLDPQQPTDLYSTRVATAIFEGLYEFEYLSTGSKVIPCTAESMPVITDDGRTWTIRLRKGILFTDDPAFKGKPRELVAADYVYSIKRVLDPNLRSGGDQALADLIVGARPVVDAASKPGAHFDYDAPMAGLRALDRYTLQIRLTRTDYTLQERLAGLQMMAVAREVVEAQGANIMTHPVGTGPYVLKEWRRASRVVLEANPHYRKLPFPDNADAPQQELVQGMRGKTLPQIGRIEISIIEESQPEILAFSQGNLDYIALGGDDMRRVMENGKLRPDLARRGVRHLHFGAPFITFTYFNMDDPTVGGYTKPQIALRRAIGMGFDVDQMIRVLFAGNALPANQLLPPGVSGFDPALPPRSIYDPAAARALLDHFGFKDRDGDGYRETPEGKPLTVLRGTLPESWYREADTLWKKNMDAIGIRMQVQQQTFAELINLSRAGKLPMFNLGYRSLEPSGYQILQTLWSKSSRDTNPSQFRNAGYDAAYEQFLRTPAGPARVALARRMSDISQAYMPMVLHTFGVGNVLEYPWVQGYWPSPFGFSWKYLDIDVAMRDAALKAMRK